MITLPIKLPTADEITNFVKWPIQNKENLIRTSIPIITFVASEMFTNLSGFFSLLLAGEICIGSELIYRKIYSKNSTPTRRAPPVRLNRPKRKPEQFALQDIQAMIDREQSQKAELQRIKIQCLPLGALLSDKSFCTEECYLSKPSLKSFTFFDITSKTIAEAWAKHPDETTTGYKSRLDYIKGKANSKFRDNFRNLQKVFKAIGSRKKLPEIKISIQADQL
ncbi:MAG: hypothetical protein KR126chlam4_00103 [Candidatus Anoxychlamydiales bacterium]|uniref:Uncharacterized protein n=1 Tax=marine sediment metagenome TaxID=412755 RepID=A0A0F9ITE8_9ZZZZ|nr:hypothetical protein [Candidatus Anoxychlamydiales bacterium]NGX40286.1 hypothetical protein [Candidatus Anoxychlamydiales bacterium]